jgi:photosystem II stability/assembly factor-like uncharacterized protein
MWTHSILVLVTSLSLASASVRDAGWTQVGPTGGSVRAMAVDPTDPNRIYLGTPQGILYRSEDAGQSWQRLDPGFPRRGCSLDEIEVDPAGVVYVGFWEVGGSGGGVARSTDGGVTFEFLKPLEGQSIRAVAIAPSNPRRMAAGSLTGVFLSDDAGQSWRRISVEGDPNLRNIGSLAFDPSNAEVLYVGTWHLAWKTIDGGASWLTVHKGMIDDSHVMTLNINRRFPQNLYATACTGIYSSTDGGSRWTKLEGIPESSRRTRSFAQSSEDVNLLLAGTTEGLWISQNRGRSWRVATSRNLVINALVLQPDGTIVLGTEEEGVMRSTDGGRTWKASNAGFTERFVSRLQFDPEHGRVVAAVWGARPNGDVYVASGVRGPWTRFGRGLENRQVLSFANLRDTLFAGTDSGIFVRPPNADRWTRLKSRVGRDVHPRVTELLALGTDRLLAATTGGLVLSVDGGRTWSTPEAVETGEVYALAASPGDPSVVLAATRRGYFRSRDGGSSWDQVSLPLNDLTPHALAFLPGDDREVLATTSGGLIRSRDQGATWDWVTGGIPRCDLTGLLVYPDGRTILASDFTRGGVFRSVDGGETWKRMPTRGLLSDRVWTLELDPADPGILLAASPAGGLYVQESQSRSSAEVISSP